MLGLTALLLGLVMSIAPLSPAGNAAHADPFTGNNAARVSAYIKPCFGALIGAESSMCGYGYGSGYGYGGDYGFHNRFRGGTVAYFDCDRGRYALDRLLTQLPPGSTLYLRGQRGWRTANGLETADLPPAYAGYSVCEISLHLAKSIIIQPDMGGSYNDHPLLIKAPQGEPCLRVESTADQVIIRNLTLLSTRGTDSSCIESLGGELTLDNSNLRYDGEEAAVLINAGRFNLTDTNLIARTEASALEVNHASLFISNSRIASTYNGIRGDLVGDSRLIGVTVIQLGDWQGFERGENARAVDVNLTTKSSIITVDQMKTLFYGNGLYLYGVGEGLISNSLFYSDHAVASALQRVRILNNYIFADEIGIDVKDGTAYIGNNHIRLVRTAAILKAPNAQLRNVNNHIATEKCDVLSWGDVAPQDRSCTPWHKQAEFGIPGGGVDWSIYGILSEACSPAPQDPTAQHICGSFNANSFKTIYAPTKNPNLDDILDRGCANESRSNALTDECRAYRHSADDEARDKDLRKKAAYESLRGICASKPQGDWASVCQDYYSASTATDMDGLLKQGCGRKSGDGLAARECDALAKRDVATDQILNVDDEAYFRALKAKCGTTQTAAWSGPCQDFDSNRTPRGKPYEDDETNIALAGGKEWLSQQLFANENNLYTVSSQTFMPLFDDYLPRPPYHAVKGSTGTQGSPDNPESGMGAPPPRNPSARPAPVPRSPAIPKTPASANVLDYNNTAR
jgi:hypothetical protein